MDKWGFTPMHGVVAVNAQETGQITDYTLLTKSYHFCKLMHM